jgi:glycosyltransferase involved in cell wall biosynthesis
MLSILMPVYNERELVARAITEVVQAARNTDFELIVVDDGSTDGTGQILRETSWDERVRLFEHPVNRGKGAAVRTALAHARGEYATTFDGDLECDPADLDRLMAPLRDDRADASFGVRSFRGDTHQVALYRVLGNKVVTLACNLLLDIRLHDVTSCQKMMRTELLRSLPLRATGFGIESEITVRLVQRGTRIVEVPVHYRPRSMAEGKKLSVFDGFTVIATLLRCRFSASSCPPVMRRAP